MKKRADEKRLGKHAVTSSPLDLYSTRRVKKASCALSA